LTTWKPNIDPASPTRGVGAAMLNRWARTVASIGFSVVRVSYDVEVSVDP
jgi:hypothetical protein